MRVTPFNFGKSVAAWVELPNGDSFLGVFDNKKATPPVGVPCEAMICNTIRRLDSQKQRYENWALLLQSVTDDHVLITHDGFQCSGSMCRTTARATTPIKMMITPGRTPVFHVDNVGANLRKARTPVPGRAYMSLTDRANGEIRISGVPDLADYDAAYLPKLRKTDSAPEKAAA